MTRLWFHRGGGGSPKRKFLSWVIKMWQGKFVHVEAQVPLYNQDGEPVFDERCKSISSRGSEKDGPNGVHWKYIDYWEHPTRWTFVDVKDDLDMDFIFSHLGDKYDYRGAVGWKWKKQDSDKWFCSELICRAFKNPWPRMYPTKMYKYAKTREVK